MNKNTAWYNYKVILTTNWVNAGLFKAAHFWKIHLVLMKSNKSRVDLFTTRILNIMMKIIINSFCVTSVFILFRGNNLREVFMTIGKIIVNVIQINRGLLFLN